MEQKKRNIKDGTKIYFTEDYGGKSQGKFTVSQWDEDKQRGWAGDKDGRGWYFFSYQVTVAQKAKVG